MCRRAFDESIRVFTLIQNQIKTLGNVDNLAHTLERLDVHQLRKIAGAFFLFPTFLEMRTLSFLSQIKAETGWTLYNLMLAVSILATMMYLMRAKGMQPREATYQGMLVLYGSAIFVSIFTYNVRRMPFLAAPFLTATGTLLLTYNDNDMEWISRIVRYSLRVSLKDVLSSVGSRVNQDEMLQLAILRWISDFWASNPGASTAENTEPNAENMGNDGQANSPTAPSTQQGDGASAASNQEAVSSSATNIAMEQQDVQWSELQAMLHLEIDHMEAEVEELQSDSDGRDHSTSGSARCNQDNTQQQQQQKQRKSANDLHSFEDLKSMLLSLNVDDRAEPAVMAYRRAVESFPPQKRTAFFISLLRRTPAFLTIIFHIVFGGTKSLLSSIIVLAPFLVFEYFRIARWMSRCQRMPNLSLAAVNSESARDSLIPSDLATVDTMTILLCGDSHSTLNSPTLLRVWHNVVSSVSALEVGLTAARCAETTAMAVQFAGSIISLAQFGFEVSQHGIMHGVGIVLKEAISVGGNFSNIDEMDNESARYTKAAVEAIHSGQRVTRNVLRLAEDEHVGAVVQPIFVALEFLSGRGWLWGHENAPSAASQNVTIEEIHEDEVQESERKDQDICDDDTPARNTPAENVPSQPAENVPSQPLSQSVEPKGQPRWNEREDEKAFESSSSLKDPHGDLCTVMDMIAEAYELHLIDEAEKSDFYKKLSNLRRDELFDPAVLSSMKRTLNIILENGCSVPLVDSEPVEDVVFEVLGSIAANSSEESLHHKCSPGLAGSSAERSLDNCQNANEEDTTSSPVRTEERLREESGGQESESRSGNNDALLRLGAAAIGMVAGGVLLSMAGGGENERERESSHRTEGHDDGTRNQSSSVVIEELSDDDDEWVEVPQ
ncbi:MAG: hypothetical protein SGILL_001686 [Bacillariaceae sp.]